MNNLTQIICAFSAARQDSSMTVMISERQCCRLTILESLPRFQRQISGKNIELNYKRHNFGSALFQVETKQSLCKSRSSEGHIDAEDSSFLGQIRRLV